MQVLVLGEGHLADATRTVLKRHRVDVIEHGWEPDVLWCCVDTPVDEDNEPDVSYVLNVLCGALAFTAEKVLTVLSSQVPVGTLARLEAMYPNRHFATQPENIRKKTAEMDLVMQRFFFVGIRHEEDKPKLLELFRSFTPDLKTILFMDPESAEMVKHTLNTFLALEIAYVNEIATVCRSVGANVDDVIKGFRSDKRVGGGPLLPGRGYTGGTLGRDVAILNKLNPGPVVAAIKPSNDRALASDRATS